MEEHPFSDLNMFVTFRRVNGLTRVPDNKFNVTSFLLMSIFLSVSMVVNIVIVCEHPKLNAF